MGNTMTVSLSPREKQIGRGLLEDKTIREIAKDLGVGYETARTYRQKLGEKLGLTTKVKIVLHLRENPALLKD